MKFAAWRKVLSIFLLAVFLCAVPSLLTDSLFPHAGIRQHGAGLRYLAVFSGAVPYRK